MNVSDLNPATLQFGSPVMLWLLVVAGALTIVWFQRALARAADRRRLLRSRQVPRRESLARLGSLPYWLCLAVSVTCLVVALAQPRVVASTVRTGGADFVLLLDGSASMHVKDVNGTRWQRSVKFLHTFGESLSWQTDRVALALFAHIATPQVRLTNDPNTLFFFLDHLGDESPFRLEDDTTWDTNIELGISWGLRIIEKDRAIRGASPNAQLFVLLSDGQAWSGRVEEALRAARARGVPVFVVGVGSETGGVIPDPMARGMAVLSRLDRPSLRAIASGGGGQYFELGRESDVEVATKLIEATRRAASNATTQPLLQDVYWPFLAAACASAMAAMLFIREPVALMIQCAGAVVTLAALASML